MAVEKVPLRVDAPIPIAPDSYRDGTPKGDLLIIKDIHTPFGGQGV
jgi:hypothetical protein